MWARTYQICDRESPSSLDRNSRSRAFSPVMVAWPSPTADLNKVSNLAWSWAVINDSRMLGILVVGLLSLLPFGFGVPPV